jgi:hypothetical protein
MNLSGIVTQLQTISTLAGKVEVGQPAQIEGVGSDPYAWITGIMEEAAPSGRVNVPSIQRIAVRLMVTVGASTQTKMLATRDLIRSALVDFYPESTAGAEPMEFRSGRMDFLDAGWMTWTDEYSYSYYFDKLQEQT